MIIKAKGRVVNFNNVTAAIVKQYKGTWNIYFDLVNGKQADIPFKDKQTAEKTLDRIIQASVERVYTIPEEGTNYDTETNQ